MLSKVNIMLQKQRYNFPSLAIAEIILAGFFVFTVSLCIVLGVAWYLAGGKPVVTREPAYFSKSSILMTPTPTIMQNIIENTADWKIYRNKKNIDENYKLVEIKIPAGWKVEDESFTMIFIADSLNPDSKFRFSFDIIDGNKIGTFKNENGEFFEESYINNIKRSEKDYKVLDFKNTAVKGMQQDKIYAGETGGHSINTYLYIEPYIYSFNFLEFDPKIDEISFRARELNDQILSTFKFVDNEVPCGGKKESTQADLFAAYLSENPGIVMSDIKLKNYFSKNLSGLISTGISRGKFDKYSDKESVILFFKPKDETGENFLPVPVTIFIVQEEEKGKWRVLQQETDSEPKQIIGYMSGFEIVDNNHKQIVKNEPQFFMGAYDPIMAGTCVSYATSFNIYRLEKDNFKLVWNVINSAIDYGDGENSKDGGYGRKGNTTMLAAKISFKDIDRDGNLEILREGVEEITSGGCDELDSKQISKEKIYEIYKWNAEKQTFESVK